MAKAQTLYDLLEVSSKASLETIQASFEALKKKYREGLLQSELLDNDTHFNLVKDAFLTLSNPETRARYDARFTQETAKQPATVYTEPIYSAESGDGWKWALVVVLGICAGFYFYTQHKVEVEKLRIAAEAQRIQQEESRRSREAEAEQQRIQTENYKARQEQAEAAGMRAALARESAQIDSNLANAARQSQYEMERQRQQEENKRRQESYEAQRQVERQRILARQLEYENRSGSPRAASISARH